MAVAAFSPNRTQSAGGERAFGGIAERRAFGIGSPHRVVVVRAEAMREITLRGFEPAVELIRFHHEGDQRLRGLRILGVVHHQDRIHQVQLGRFADRSDRPEGMVHVLGDLLFGRILLRRDVDRNSIVGPIEFTGQEGLVVGRIVPGCNAGDHVVGELLGIFQRLGRLRRVDDDLVVLVDRVAAVRPQAPVGPAVAVARRVTERHAARRVVLLHRLCVFEERVGRLRELGEAGLLRGF